MDNHGEQPSDVLTKDKVFSSTGFATDGSCSSLTSYKSNLHYAMDTGSLIHRSHAFSYNPWSPRSIEHAYGSSGEVSGEKEKTIRMTLTTADGKPPRRNRRRSSLLGAAVVEQQKQIPFSKSSFTTLTKDYGTPISGRRSPRRYSAAQGSLDDISRDAAASLQTMYAATISSQDENFQRSTLAPWTPPNQSSRVWEDSAGNQSLATPSLLPVPDVTGNMFHTSVSRENTQLLSGITGSGGVGYHGSSVDVSDKILQLSLSSDTTKQPQRKILQALSLAASGEKDVESSLKTQGLLDKVIHGTDWSGNKVVSTSPADQTMVSGLNIGFNTAGKFNQNVPSPHKNYDLDLAENAIKENSALSNVPVKLNSTAPETKTNVDPGASQLAIASKLPENAGVSNEAHTSAVDTGFYKDGEIQDYKYSGPLSWAWKLGAWLGTTSESDKVEVSKKDLNLVAPSSF
ncbi:hypothetical protein ElyMa_004500300 [Elysia marginata]|uniref:Uncharacterized protein n=1 Tax=Elysia marginata TaxID=1093978 RepID=A0AAV4HNN3_9GAST|nr:hypothetical protein ElyMa_004500300 [Elysia marginata]